MSERLDPPAAGGLSGREREILTEVQVVEIRRQYAAGGVSFVRLALAFGVGRTTVENVVKGRKWAHVRVA